MRLAQLYSSACWQNALESAGIALIGVCVAVLLTQRSFEVSAVVKTSSRDPRLLVQQLRQAAENVSATRAVVASVEQSGANGLRISCRSEQQALALQACEQLARECANPPQLAQLVSSPKLPSSDQTQYYVALALLLALLWFAMRVRQGRRLRARRSDPELEGWRVAGESQSGGDDAGDRLADAVTASDIRALSGKQPANEASFSAFEGPTTLHPRPQPHTATRPDSPRSAEEVQLAPRIIFRVGGNPFAPDGNVLTDAAVAQLREVCTQLLAASPRQRVVRVASGVSGRYAKTQVTAQLSAMLAEQAELPVLALEGDIDAPALHKAMRLEAPLGLGLSEQLERMLRQGRTGRAAVIRVEGNLHALVESRTSSPATFGSPQFEQLVEQLRAQHDFVIVDGPVLDTWPDSEHLSHCTDDIIMVAAAGTRLRDTHALMERHFDEDAVLSVITAGDWSRLTGSM